MVALRFRKIDPMLAESLDFPIERVDEQDWFAEYKYDGTRIIAQKFGGEVRLYTRRGVERSADLPRITDELERNLPNNIIIDGEVAYFNDAGISELLSITANDEKMRERGLKPRFMVFDILQEGETDLTQTELHERKQLLERVVPEGEYVDVVEFWRRGFAELLGRTRERGQEGLMLKKRDSWYYTGTRSSVWRKVKHFSERDVVIVGYTDGEGARSNTFGSLVMYDGEKYIGKVGSGFSRDEREQLLREMRQTPDRIASVSQVGERYTAVEPWVAAVKYQKIGPNDKLRSPVYLRRRNDKPLEDVTPV